MNAVGEQAAARGEHRPARGHRCRSSRTVLGRSGGGRGAGIVEERQPEPRREPQPQHHALGALPTAVGERAPHRRARRQSQDPTTTAARPAATVDRTPSLRIIAISSLRGAPRAAITASYGLTVTVKSVAEDGNADLDFAVDDQPVP